MSLLDASERLAFGKYLASPFFNHRKDGVALYQAFLDAKRPAELEKEALWQLVFGSATFDSGNYNRLCSRLLKLLEAYLAHANWQERQNLEKIHLGKFYMSRGADPLAYSTFKDAMKRLDKETFRGSDHHYARYQLSQTQYNASRNESDRVGKGLQDMSRNLDLWFAIEKLKHACSRAAQLNVSDQDAPLDFLEEVLERVEKNAWMKVPIVGVYWHAYRMLVQENGDADYHDLRQMLEEDAELLRQDEQRTVFLMAINFCIQELNSGRQFYVGEVYRLYKIGLRDGWLFEQGELSPWTYKNVVAAGLKLGDFEGVESFIEGFRMHLPEVSRGTFYKYNLAELQFARGQFRETLRTLRYLQFKEPLSQLRARLLQIKAAYELGEKGLVEYQVANLLKLVKRKKSLAYHRESYRAFAGFARRLVVLWEEDESARAGLVADVEAVDAVVEREWLLEKLS